MCDYSLTLVSSRAAKIGEKLVTRNFGMGTRGFCSPDDPSMAVCLLPGTEIAFEQSIEANVPTTPQHTARFRQINKDVPYMHHDALELPDGQDNSSDAVERSADRNSPAASGGAKDDRRSATTNQSRLRGLILATEASA